MFLLFFQPQVMAGARPFSASVVSFLLPFQCLSHPAPPARIPVITTKTQVDNYGNLPLFI